MTRGRTSILILGCIGELVVVKSPIKSSLLFFTTCAREIPVASGVTLVTSEKSHDADLHLNGLCTQFFIYVVLLRGRAAAALSSSKRMDEHLSVASCYIVNSWYKACQSRWLHQVLLALVQRAPTCKLTVTRSLTTKSSIPPCAIAQSIGSSPFHLQRILPINMLWSKFNPSYTHIG